MSKVFIPQEVMYRNNTGALVPKFQMHLAEQYGELDVMLPYGNQLITPKVMIRKLKQKLKDFSDEDYILPTGDPITIGVAISAAADVNQGRVRLLRWDKVSKQYKIVNLNLRGF